MNEPLWLIKEAVLAFHEQSLAEFGGEAGIRDEGLLESALGKPGNLLAYGRPSLFEMTASYASGIIHNHPFIDGNKRAGFLAAVVFLHLNGFEFIASEVDATLETFALAAGELTESEYAGWLEKNTRKVSD